MFESIWLMLGASRWWRRLTGSLSAVANWVGQSALHVVLTALLAAIALNLWQWHERDAIAARDARRLAESQAAFAQEQRAFREQSQASATLRAALASQNATIEGLARAGAARAAGARGALVAANARDAGLDAVAGQIRGALAQPATGAGCRTPEAVMAARDVL